jgi:hypothetical protein
MNCNEIKNMFLDYLDNNLDTETKLKIEKHLEHCKICSGELLQIRLLNERISNMKKFENPKYLFDTFMLKLEKEKNKLEKWSFGINSRSLFRIAASILIFITGLLSGVLVVTGYLEKTRIKEMENEISKLKNTAVITMFNQHSTSDRIKALTYFDETEKISPDLLRSLENALLFDDNVNVRLAAVNALFRYKDNEQVMELLIKCLGSQDEPMVQIAIIKFLVDNREKRAAESLQYLIKNDNTNIFVKQYADQGLHVLL